MIREYEIAVGLRCLLPVQNLVPIPISPAQTQNSLRNGFTKEDLGLLNKLSGDDVHLCKLHFKLLASAEADVTIPLIC